MCIERLPPTSLGSSGNFVQEVPDGHDIFENEYDPEEIYVYSEYNTSNDDNLSDNFFNEYLWMANEEEFEQEEIQRLEEEELINQCMEDLSEMVLLDEIRQVEAEQHKE